MVSKSRQKGYRTVALGKAVFKSHNYICANLEKSGRFIKDKDLFSLWDYLFIKGKRHVFVQFKTNLRGKKWMEPYIEFGRQHNSKCVRYEIWNKFDYKGFRVIDCNGGEKDGEKASKEVKSRG